MHQQVRDDQSVAIMADLHIKWVVPSLAAPIDGHIITSVCLVDVDVPLLCHIMEVLRRVDTLAERGGPRGGIHTSPLML
jgi:hypothetical protein